MISPTEGELTSRRAMHRSARTALHHNTTLHCSTPLHTALLCSASPRHRREKPVSPSTQKTLSFSFILRMVGERSVAPTLAPWKSGEEICVTKSDTAGGVSSPRVPAEQRKTGSGYAGREGAAAAYSLTWKLPEKPPSAHRHSQLPPVE